MSDPRIAVLKRQLQDLENQKMALERQQRAPLAEVPSSELESKVPAVADGLSSKAKIALFRRLFAGRSDIFALRWENAKDGRSGYAPACANEWIGGVCGKPKIKCGARSNQAFLPVTDETVERHLRGPARSNNRADFVMGVRGQIRRPRRSASE